MHRMINVCGGVGGMTIRRGMSVKMRIGRGH
jgi:hypothetical protein